MSYRALILFVIVLTSPSIAISHERLYFTANTGFTLSYIPDRTAGSWNGTAVSIGGGAGFLLNNYMAISANLYYSRFEFLEADPFYPLLLEPTDPYSYEYSGDKTQLLEALLDLRFSNFKDTAKIHGTISVGIVFLTEMIGNVEVTSRNLNTGETITYKAYGTGITRHDYVLSHAWGIEVQVSQTLIPFVELRFNHKENIYTKVTFGVRY